MTIKKTFLTIAGLLLMIQVGFVDEFNVSQVQAVTETELPDLIIESVELNPSTLVLNQKFSAEVTVKNNSNKEFFEYTRGLATPFKILTCELIQDNVTLIWNTQSKYFGHGGKETLGAGQSKTYTLSDLDVRLLKNSNQLKCVVDPDNKHEELNEGNNEFVLNFSVTETELPEITAKLVRAAGHHKVYRIVNGKKLWIPTVSAFNAQGLKWSDIQEISKERVDQCSRIKLLQVIGDSKIYYITESGLKKHIPNSQVFLSYDDNNWDNVVRVNRVELNAYPDNVLIRAEDDYKVYRLENSKKRWIKTAEAFNRMGYDWSNITTVNTVEINAHSTGAEIS